VSAARGGSRWRDPPPLPHNGGMRTVLPLAAALAAFLAWSPAATAQEDTAALQEKLQHKLELPFIAHGGWITDFDQAKEKAKAEDKLIFVYFSRSYSP
jgi:hypothetical protein